MWWVLLNISGSSGLFWLQVEVRAWPSFCILTSGFKSSRLLDLAVIDMKTMVINWNSRYVHTVQVQRTMQENKDTNGLVVTASYPWWVRDPFIHHQQIPLQMWGYFLLGKKYSPAFSNHQIGNLRGSCKLPQLHNAEPDLWDPTTSFWAHPGMPENVTLLGDAEWIGEVTKVTIHPAGTNLHQKIMVLAALILVWADPGGWATWPTHKQLKWN